MSTYNGEAQKADLRRIVTWAKEQNFWGKWMPEPREVLSYGCYLGEYLWSGAFQDLEVPADLENSWIAKEIDHPHVVPSPILPTSTLYTCEGTSLDCSLDESVHLHLPAPWMFDVLSLRWNGVEGEYVDPACRVVAFDPSSRSPGPGALLVDEEHLRNGLTNHDLTLFWMLLGGKRIHRDIINPERDEGELQVSGVAWISDERIKVHLNPVFQRPRLE